MILLNRFLETIPNPNCNSGVSGSHKLKLASAALFIPISYLSKSPTLPSPGGRGHHWCPLVMGATHGHHSFICCPTVAPGCPLCSHSATADRSDGSRILEADWLLKIPDAVVKFLQKQPRTEFIIYVYVPSSDDHQLVR